MKFGPQAFGPPWLLQSLHAQASQAARAMTALTSFFKFVDDSTPTELASYDAHKKQQEEQRAARLPGLACSPALGQASHILSQDSQSQTHHQPPSSFSSNGDEEEEARMAARAQRG